MSELDDLQKTAVDALWVLTAEQRREVLRHFCPRCHERVFDLGPSHVCPKKDAAARHREHRRKRRDDQ